MSRYGRLLISGGVILVALVLVLVQYWEYVTNPWTRNGYVRAQVIQITPRVSGPIVQLPIEDNQLVRKGDLLFEIDPRTFTAARKAAEADLRIAEAQSDNARNDADRYRAVIKTSPGAVSQEELAQKVDTQRAAEAQVKAAQADLENARLEVEFTRVLAPVDGYVTNLNLRMGSHGVENQPALALVDLDSFWVHGYFRETVIGDIRPGDRAVVTLMTYPDLPLQGQVESLGWGIAQDDGSMGEDLLPQVEPTFEWIRLAQRVPVRIRLGELPDQVELRVGMTASVLVMTGTSGSDEPAKVAPAPRALQ